MQQGDIFFFGNPTDIVACHLKRVWLQMVQVGNVHHQDGGLTLSGVIHDGVETLFKFEQTLLIAVGIKAVIMGFIIVSYP